MKRQRILLWSGIALAVTALASSPFWLSKKQTITYQTVPVERGNLSAKVTASGTLSALVTVQVGSQVSGRIQQLMVDYNSPVRKGQALAKLDPQLFLATVNQSRANYLEAKSGLEKSRVQALEALRQYRRTKLLAEQRLIAQADLDAAQSNLGVANAQVTASQASVERARASLHQAEVNLNYTTIYSPIDGVVISRSVDAGQTVAASFQSPTLFQIAQDLRKIQVDASIAEADIGQLKPGMKAEFTVDAYPNRHFIGTVRQIRNAAQTVQNVVTYDAVIDVSNKDLLLKPGMTANVSILYAERNGVLCIPNAALRFHPPVDSDKQKEQPKRVRKEVDASKRSVWTLVDNKPHRIRITTGISDGSMTEVVGGELKEGDRLITESTGGKSDSASGNQNRQNRRNGPRGMF